MVRTPEGKDRIISKRASEAVFPHCANFVLVGQPYPLDHTHKETGTAAIKALQGHGVAIEVATGDNELVAQKICREVRLSTEFSQLGSDVEAMHSSAGERS